MDSADGWGDDVYQPDGSEVQDDAGLLDAEDTLVADGVSDPLDRGWSPPERPWAVEHRGVTHFTVDAPRAPSGRARDGAASSASPVADVGYFDRVSV